MDVAIECKNVTKTFKANFLDSLIKKKGDKTAVNNLSFEVYKGEIYGLLGPNGAGKTTTLRMLSTLIKPTCGEIYVNNKLISETDMRKHIGFLTDELRLEDGFSADYYYNYFGRLYNMSDEEIENRKETIFKLLGIDKFKNVNYGTLSTGMKQKVSLAVSIVHDPSIVIFDEPTNGLDIVASKHVIDFIKEMKKQGKTVIISTHIFSLAEDICDRIGIIIDGQMKKVFNVEDIKKENSSIENEFFKINGESE